MDDLGAVIALKSLSVWHCTTVGSHAYLSDDLSVPCSGPDYQLASNCNLVFVIGVVLGWPCFLIWFSSLSLFDCLYLAMQVSDSDDKKITMVHQFVLVMNTFSFLVPHARD